LVYVPYRDRAPLVLADIAPDSPFAKGIRPGGTLAGLTLRPAGKGLYELVQGDRSNGFLHFDGRRLRCAPEKALAADPLGTPGPKVTAPLGFTATFGRLDAKAGALLYVPRFEALLPKADDRPSRRPQQAFRVFGLRFIRALTEMDRFGAIALRVDIADGILIEQVAEMKGLEPGPGARLVLLNRLPADSITAAAARCGGFASACDRLRRAMRAVDRDISDEFDEELAEVNRDLGFDFEKDFLANLGREYAFVRDAKGGWALLFTVKDGPAFLRHAEALAKFGKEPWTRATLGGKAVFRTRAYTVPLVVALDGEVGILAASDALLTAILRPPEPGRSLASLKPLAAAAAKGESPVGAALWRPMADPQWRRFLDTNERGLSRLLRQSVPSDATVWLRVDDGPGYRRVRIGMLRVTRDQMRMILRDVVRPLLGLRDNR